MNLDELQSVQSRERQTDSLQQLRGSFYEEAGRFIQQLREEREHVAEQCDDPFDAPDVQRLTNDINTAEQTVEAIYERRIGKLVKQASLEAAGMTADAAGLTTEEREMFDRLVATIEENREHVLGVIANGQERNANEETTAETETRSDERTDEPDAVPNPDANPVREREQRTNSMHSDDSTASNDSAASTDSTDATDSTNATNPTDSVEASSAGDESQGLSVADVMGDGSETGTRESDGSVQQVPQNVDPSQLDADHDQLNADHDQLNADHDQLDTSDTDGEIDDAPGRDESTFQVDRTTVKITRDVGKILCVDEREYDLSKNDVVELPETNIGPLLANDAAERLD